MPTPSFVIEAPDIASDLSSSSSPEGVTYPDYLETLKVLVGLIEQSRAELRGHSADVARLCGRVCARMGIDEVQSHGVVVAAYMHDIGKSSTYHLTALNVAQYSGHRVQAEKTYLTPLRLFETVQLPTTTAKALTHMYERFDGKGFPDRLSGKDVPLAARILAVVETYSDLTTHAKNPFRRVLPSKEACSALDEFKGRFFDPNVVDIFRLVVTRANTEAILADRPRVLVVDPDPEETTVLELRLVERGYEVVIVRDSKSALAELERQEVDLVISEVEVAPLDGFGLLQKIHEQGKESVPFVFLTRRSDRQSVTKGFELGAADYLVKPAAADVIGAKAQQLLAGRDRRSRGVNGSLSEMSLPDVVQVLSNGRKTGLLKISASGRRGEIYFRDGNVYDATFGELRREEAFYVMLSLREGTFTLDPGVQPETRVIEVSTEGLLLEGMRRYDEASG